MDLPQRGPPGGRAHRPGQASPRALPQQTMSGLLYEYDLNLPDLSFKGPTSGSTVRTYKKKVLAACCRFPCCPRCFGTFKMCSFCSESCGAKPDPFNIPGGVLRGLHPITALQAASCQKTSCPDICAGGSRSTREINASELECRSLTCSLCGRHHLGVEG